MTTFAEVRDAGIARWGEPVRQYRNAAAGTTPAHAVCAWCFPSGVEIDVCEEAPGVMAPLDVYVTASRAKHYMEWGIVGTPGQEGAPLYSPTGALDLADAFLAAHGGGPK